MRRGFGHHPHDRNDNISITRREIPLTTSGQAGVPLHSALCGPQFPPVCSEFPTVHISQGLNPRTGALVSAPFTGLRSVCIAVGTSAPPSGNMRIASGVYTSPLRGGLANPSVRF